MEITVNSNNQYREVIINDGNVNLMSGLLDTDERVEIAEQMISAAYELLTSEHHSVQKSILAALQEDL